MADDKRKENLRKWKPGESGNPTGKPGKEGSITRAIRRKLSQPDPYATPDQKHAYVGKGQTWADTCAQVALWNACYGGNKTGSYKGVEVIASRVDGKPVEKVELNATVAQQSEAEHAQQIIEIFRRLKQDEESGDTRIN